jgi:hypothetical protein
MLDAVVMSVLAALLIVLGSGWYVLVTGLFRR